MTPPNIAVQWFVVRTKPNFDAQASQRLAAQGYQVYFPVYRKRRSHARRVDVVAAPLFPGYGFVALDLTCDRWRAINGTAGVDRLLSNGDVPLRVALGVVERILESRDAGGFVPLLRATDFASGDAVRVMDGRFATAVGLVEGLAARDRIAILLQLLGRDLRLEFDVHSVEKAA